LVAHISYTMAQMARIRSWLQSWLSRSARSSDFRATATAFASGGESNGRPDVGAAPVAGSSPRYLAVASVERECRRDYPSLSQALSPLRPLYSPLISFQAEPLGSFLSGGSVGEIAPHRLKHFLRSGHPLRRQSFFGLSLRTWRSFLLSGSAGEIAPHCLKHFLRSGHCLHHQFHFWRLRHRGWSLDSS